MVSQSGVTFTPVHFMAGNATLAQQLFSGPTVPLPLSPPRSSVTFDHPGRTIAFELHCHGFASGASNVSLWPLRGEVRFDDILARGVRLDVAPANVNDDGEITIIGQPQRYNLRLGLQRPPKLWYEYPLEVNTPIFSGGRGRGGAGQGRGGRGGGRTRRRATEEDYIGLKKDRLETIDGHKVWKRNQALDPVSVVGLPNTQASYKPGNWLTLEFTFALSASQLHDLRQTLVSLRASTPTPLFDALPTKTLPPTMPLPPNPGSLLSSIVPFRFETRYLMEGLISYGVVTGEDLTLLCACLKREGESEDARDRILGAMFALGRVSGRIKQVLDDLRIKLTSIRPSRPLSSHAVLVRRALVTPTRLLLCPPEQETSNYVLRNHPNHIDRFLRVQFADESEPMFYADIWNDHRDEPVPPNMGKFCPGRGMVGRVRRVLQGGLEFSGRKWKFLAAGGSQLKERQAWFISEDGEDFTVSKLLAWMGDFTHEKVIAKHCARISLCFSTTRLVRAPRLEILQMDDIESPDGRYCFTDGVGLTSQLILDRCARILEGDGTTPGEFSAVQVRIGGAKGMLGAWPHVQGEKIVLRKSMVKFESESKKLGAMKVAKWAPAHLNRQAIMILDSMGVDKDVLLRAFEAQLSHLDELADQAALPDVVDELQATPFPIQRLVRAGLGDNPLVRDALKLVQLVLRWELKWKARIRVEKGVYLYGVADELGVLEEGEIFCRYSNPANAAEQGVVEGDCLVFRSPALHPGDIQHARAVAHPDLIAAGLKNVIVFSTKGRRDMPNMLSGGDLDGDTFTLLWDPAILQHTHSSPPMDFTPGAKLATVPDVKAEHIRKWFVDYIMNDVLGTVSTAHLAIADRMGVRDQACLQLAKLASDAVDYTKSGTPVIYPPQLRLLAKRRPDYLGSFNPEHVYESRHLLGTLFRLVSDDFSFSPSPSPSRSVTPSDQPAAHPSRSAYVPVPHTSAAHNKLVALAKYVPIAYLVEAARLRKEYEVDLLGGMRRYRLTELEVVTGLVGGLAVPVERRRGMMKDDGLKTSIHSHLLHLSETYLSLSQPFIHCSSPSRSSPLSSAQTFALASYLTEHHPPSAQRVWDEENEIVPLDAFGEPLHSGSGGGAWEDEEGLGRSFWMIFWGEGVEGLLQGRQEGKRAREEGESEVGEEDLKGRRAARRVD